MKRLSVIRSRLKQYIEKNRKVFWLFIIGGILNTILLIYMYGNLRPDSYNYNSNSIVYREYRVLFDYHLYKNEDGTVRGVSFNNPDRNHIDAASLKALCDTGLFESITIQSAYPNYDSSKGERVDSICSCIYGRLYDNFISSGQRTLTGNDQVVVDVLDDHKLGSKVEIRGNEYEVVAKSSDIDVFGYMMSPEAYFKLEPFSNGIIAYSSKRWHADSNEGDAAMAAIQTIFPDCYVWKVSKAYETADKLLSDRETRSLILTYAVSQIAYVFLLSYLADSLSEENSISIIIGARPSVIAFSAFLEGLLLSIVSGTVGIVMHIALYFPLFNKLNSVEGIVYFTKDYLVILFIVILVSSVVLFLYSLRYLKRSPVDLKRSSWRV